MTHGDDIKGIDARVRLCENDIATIKTDMKHGEKRMCEIKDAVDENTRQTVNLRSEVCEVMGKSKSTEAVKNWLGRLLVLIVGALVMYFLKGGAI